MTAQERRVPRLFYALVTSEIRPSFNDLRRNIDMLIFPAVVEWFADSQT